MINVGDDGEVVSFRVDYTVNISLTLFLILSPDDLDERKWRWRCCRGGSRNPSRRGPRRRSRWGRIFFVVKLDF